MTFNEFNFDPNLAKAIKQCGYEKPTPIQMRSIPEILQGHDLVASAQTGTGKTAAFILPTLQRLSLKPPMTKPRVLILSPTRELAAQIIDAAYKYGKFLQFKMVTLVGGAPYRQQLKSLAKPCDIIVATPGRLIDHMENKKIDLSGVEMLILDEADRMLDMGFIDDVKFISKSIPQSRQTLLFSATVDDRLSQVIRQLLKNPVRIDLSAEKMAPVSIQQELYIADSNQHKAELLQHFLTEESIFKAIIFSATKINADKLAKQLRDQGLSVAALHGDLKQAVRNRTIEQFRRGKIQYLIATDVASRGIDVSDVTHVINYDLPKFSEDYVHRIGRTGRAGKTGIAISFVLPIENRHLQKIERYMGQRLVLSTIPGLEAKQSMASEKKSTAGSKKKKFKEKFSKQKNKQWKEGKSFGDKGSKKYGKSSGDNSWNKDKKHSAHSPKKYSDSARDKDKSPKKYGDVAHDNKSWSEGKKFKDKGAKKYGDASQDNKSWSEGKKFRDKGAKKYGDASQDNKSWSESKKFRDKGHKKYGESSRDNARWADDSKPKRREVFSVTGEKAGKKSFSKKWSDKADFAGVKKPAKKSTDSRSATGSEGRPFKRFKEDARSGKPSKRFVAKKAFGKK